MSDSNEQKVNPSLEQELEDDSETRDELVQHEEASFEPIRDSSSRVPGSSEQLPAPQIRGRRRHNTGGGRAERSSQPVQGIVQASYLVSEPSHENSRPSHENSRPSHENSRPSQESSQPLDIPQQGRSQASSQIVRPQTRQSSQAGSHSHFSATRSQSSFRTSESESPDLGSQAHHHVEPQFSFDDPESELHPNQPLAQQPVIQHDQQQENLEEDDKDDSPTPPAR